MARKRRKKKPRPRKPPAPPRFAVGDEVRVTCGTRDPNFPDIPLGGWAGTISEVDDDYPPNYLVEWNKQTLDQMHPIFRKRCARDDLEFEYMWLQEADLEPNVGDALPMEQPVNLVLKPLQRGDPDDRIRAIFDLTSDDPLPELSIDNLAAYHRYLETHLSFPFAGRYEIETGAFETTKIPVTVVSLIDPDDLDEDEGIQCQALEEEEEVELSLDEIEATVNIHNRRLLKDYSYWFHNAIPEEYGLTDDEELAAGAPAPIYPPPAWLTRPGFYLYLLMYLALVGAVCGLIVGTVLVTVPEMIQAAEVGAGILASIGCLVGWLIGHVGTKRRISTGVFLIWGGILGALAGGLSGVIVLALIAAPWGALLGALAGGLLGKWRAGLSRRTLGMVFRGAVGTVLGAVMLLTYRASTDPNPEVWSSVWPAALFGSLIGIAGIIVLGLALFASIHAVAVHENPD
jgi:hypothetical protein